MDKKSKEKLFVNLITGLRALGAVALIPVFYALGPIVTAEFFLLFIATDWIDGFLARKFGVSTFFGALLDGMSDKLFGFISLFLLCNTIPSMTVAILLELSILGFGTISVLKGNSAKSTMVGKSKMWVLALGVFIGLITCDYSSFIELCRNFNFPILSIEKVKSIQDGVSSAVIASEVLTLGSYVLRDKKESIESIQEQRVNLLKEKDRLLSLKDNLLPTDELMNKLLDTDFYENNKDKRALGLFLKKTK